MCSPVISKLTTDVAVASKFSLRLTVKAKEAISDGIVRLELVGEKLPSWEPGAHIELALSDDLIRAYSIVSGQPGLSYELAVLNEPNSRGGSRYIHEQLNPGDIIAASEPKNSFALEPASSHVFIAGGIGITPILPMIDSLKKAGKPWKLFYLGRSRARMAYLPEVDKLENDAPGSVAIHIDDEGTSIELAGLIDSLDEGTAIYTCGPNGLMDALAVEIVRRPSLSMHMERFGRAELAPPTEIISNDDATSEGCDPDGSFEIELHKSGEIIQVGNGESVLDCVRKVRQGLSFSCSDGYCGTCETAVLSGTPDHRDTVLTDQEREEGRTMMICVSRSRTRKLVLDL